MSNISNPFEHHHHHHHDEVPEVYDPAQASLADALRVTFGILKILMIVMLVSYLVVSSWHNIDQQHVGIRLRMGRIVGDSPESQVLQSGGVFTLPYPFEEILEVETTPTTLNIDEAFWWQIQQGGSADEVKQGPLNPARDGSLLTADANIIHARWSITYRIKRRIGDMVDPAAVIQFAQNVGTPESAESLARAAAERGIVHAAAMTRADDLMKSAFDVAVARQHIQSIFDAVESGLSVMQLTITRPTMPGPVSNVYQRVTEAVAEKARVVDEARRKRENILKNTAGEAHDVLWSIIQAYETAHVGADEADRQRAAAILNTLDRALLTGQIAPEDVSDLVVIDGPRSIHGEVAEIISTATAYRETVISDAKREAKEFADLQPKFADNAMIFKTDRFSSSLAAILTSPTVQTHYVNKDILLEIDTNPDPLIKKLDEEESLKHEAKQH